MLAARLVAEMLHRVGEIDFRPAYVREREEFIEQAARRPDERPARAVLFVARLLADKH